MSTPYKSFLVAPERTGVDLGVDPWLTPLDAFQSVYDAYSYLGVMTKREGYEWFDAVPHAIAGAGPTPYQNITNVTVGPNSVVTLSVPVPAFITNGAVIRLTDVQGLVGSPPINGTRWTISNVAGNTFQINNTAPFVGAFVPGFGTASFFPALLAPPNQFLCPITAIAVWVDQGTGINYTIVCDSLRASIYDTSALNGCLIPIGVADQFTAPQPFLFWWENYITPSQVALGGSASSIFLTNNVDPIFRWGFPTPASSNYAAYSAGLIPFIPHFTSAKNATDAVNTCLMIKAFGSRLVLFNTNEGNTNPQARPVRIRWCRFNTDPTIFAAGPPYNNPWDDIVPGQGGGFFDVVDSLRIITLGQIQRNIIFVAKDLTFSSWIEMREVNDPQKPFAFTTISSSRNIESTFGTVVLDRQITAVGNTGLINCDGNTTSRYDQKIPQFAIDNIDQEAFEQCFGIRNDDTWQTWLLFPTSEEGDPSENQTLVFNYQEQSWSIYRNAYNSILNNVATRISLTCLGIIEFPLVDPIWISYGSTLPDLAWADFGEQTWISSVQKASNVLVGGDQLGNVWYMNAGGGDAANNTVFGQPIDNGQAIKMNLVTRQWYPFASDAIAAQFGYVDMLVDGDPLTTGKISFNVDNEITSYLTTNFSLIPWEDIVLAEITNITNANPAQVTAPDHGLQTGDVIFIFGVDGMTQINDLSYTVAVIDANNFTLVGTNTLLYDIYTGSGVIAKQAITQTTFWMRVWAGQTGVFHQMNIIAGGVDEGFRLHAMNCAFKPSGRIYKG